MFFFVVCKNSCVIAMTSCIFLPLRKLNCYSEIDFDSLCLSLMEITLQINLYIILLKEMDQKSLKIIGFEVLGIRAINVEFKEPETTMFCLESSSNYTKSSPINSKKWIKISTIQLSRHGLLFLEKFFRTNPTSSLLTSL